MKVAVASIAGVVIVGSLALLVFTATRPGDSTPDLARAPAVTPSAEPVAEPAAAPEEPATPDEVTDPAPAIEPATLAGTVRDENEQPIASAEVYLAMQPPLEDDDMARLFLRADYFARSRFLETQTDAAGRYAFEGVLEFGSATLGAFKEGHAGVTQRMTRKAGAATQQVDLVLRAGKTLTGTILDTDGAPVTDAVVSVHGAWSPTSHVFWGAGMGPTDADGRFRVGVGKETTGCHVRVNSDSHGQGFFIEVPVTDEDVELTLKKFARVEGTITWADGAPASGLTVRVNGRLPEPPIPVQRMGRRAVVVHDGLVGDDGTYAIEGLHAQLGYDIFVIDGSLGEVEARRKPLSPRMRHSFRLEPGEVKVWDHSVSRPITIRGRIRTETNGEPLPRAQVGVRKDGKSINDVFAEADDEGFFTLHLNSGAGEYVVHAEPPGDMPTPDPVSDLLAERFGRTLHLAGSEDVEVELAIFDAAVLPIRVLDHSGEPVGTVRTKLHLTFPDGRRAHHDMPRTLDETGRVVFAFHYPATELWYEISAFRNGPAAETRRYEIHPGAVLPEETIKLPRTCDLLAKLVDPSGETVSDRWVSLRVVYEDGTRQVVSSRTDRRGVIDEKGCVRAAPFALELRVGSNVIWKSERVDGTAAEALDLGEIVVE